MKKVFSVLALIASMALTACSNKPVIKLYLNKPSYEDSDIIVETSYDYRDVTVGGGFYSLSWSVALSDPEKKQVTANIENTKFYKEGKKLEYTKIGEEELLIQNKTVKLIRFETKVKDNPEEYKYYFQFDYVKFKFVLGLFAENNL